MLNYYLPSVIQTSFFILMISSDAAVPLFMQKIGERSIKEIVMSAFPFILFFLQRIKILSEILIKHLLLSVVKHAKKKKDL